MLQNARARARNKHNYFVTTSVRLDRFHDVSLAHLVEKVENDTKTRTYARRYDDAAMTNDDNSNHKRQN